MFKQRLVIIFQWVYKYSFPIIVLLATSFRLYYYIINPSFFLDEARTGAFLYKDINWYFGITWPMGQLWLQQVISSLFGYSEYVLRLTPLLASILSLFVVYNLIEKWFGKKFATIFLALFAISPLAMQFSIEYKQYSVDLLLTASYMLLFTNILNTKIISKRDLIFFIVMSVLGVWFSYPLIFTMLTSTGIYLLLRKFKIDKESLKVSIATGLGLVSFVILYLLFIKQSTQATGLVDYWNAYYMPLNPIALVHWLKFIALDTSANLLGFKSHFVFLGIVLMALGAFAIVFDKKYKEILFFLSPLFLVLIASIFKKYPFGERVLFFLLPSFYMLIAYGILALEKVKSIKVLSRFREVLQYLPHLVFVISLMTLGYISVVYMHTLVIREPLRPVMQQLQEKYNKDVSKLPVHVSATAKDAWHYYNHRFNISDASHITFSTWNTKGMLKDIDDTKVPTWFVWSHIQYKVLKSYLAEVKKKGKITEEIYLKDYPTTRAILFIPNEE